MKIFFYFLQNELPQWWGVLYGAFPLKLEFPAWYDTWWWWNTIFVLGDAGGSLCPWMVQIYPSTGASEQVLNLLYSLVSSCHRIIGWFPVQIFAKSDIKKASCLTHRWFGDGFVVVLSVVVGGSIVVGIRGVTRFWNNVCSTLEVHLHLWCVGRPHKTNESDNGCVCRCCSNK